MANLWLLSAIVLLLYAILTYLERPAEFRRIVYPAGMNSGFMRMMASYKALFQSKAIMADAYSRFALKDRVCILPGFFANMVQIPVSQIQWAVAQPDSTLSAKIAQTEALQIQYTMLDPEVAINPVHGVIVRRQLNRHLNGILDRLHTEIRLALVNQWGSDETDFQKVSLSDTIPYIIARTVNQAFIGERFARDPQFIKDALGYVDTIVASGLLLRMLPPFWRPKLAPLITLRNKWQFQKCAKLLVPFFEQEIWRHSKARESLPEQYSTWHLDALSSREFSDIERTPKMLSRRIMALNFASIHTTTMTASNLFLNLVHAPPEQDCLTAITRECRDLALQYTDNWERSRLKMMCRLDSSLRESMRLSGFITKGLQRLVLPKEGITLPSGEHVSQGTVICDNTYGIQHDESNYRQPESFIYDRFLDLERPSAAAMTGTQIPPMGVIPEKLADMPKTPPPGSRRLATDLDQNFAQWGYGRHACPGRVLATDLIKMLTAEALESYELRAAGPRAQAIWVESNPIPPLSSVIEVRYRGRSRSEDPKKACPSA